MSHDLTLFPIDHFSLPELTYSQLSLYLQCKFRYKAKHIDKLLRQDQRPSFYLSVGRSLHLALAELYSPTNHEPFLSASISATLASHWHTDGFRSAADERSWHSKAEAMLLRFAEGHPPGHTIVVETNFKQRVDDYILQSRIDRIDKLEDGFCEIIDYKVGDYEESPEKRKLDLQWAFHYLASADTLARTHGLTISSIRFCYLQSATDFSLRPETALIQASKARIIGLAEEIRTQQHFPPTLNRYCTDCRFDTICPLIRDLKGKGISLEDALGTQE